MFRRSIVAAVVAATAIAAPAAHAQEIIAPAPTPDAISPANPTGPTANPAQPENAPQPQITFGNCTVGKSTHGYAYASCAISANFVPSGTTVTASYKASLPTFKPRTKVNWANGSGTVQLSNDSVGGGTGSVTTTVKMAFKGKTAEQVRRGLVLVATGSSGAELIQPISSAHG